MTSSSSQKLSPQGKRLRMVILSAPVMVAVSLVLYQRLVGGKPQRKLPAQAASVTVVDHNAGGVQTSANSRN